MGSCEVVQLLDDLLLRLEILVRRLQEIVVGDRRVLQGTHLTPLLLLHEAPRPFHQKISPALLGVSLLKYISLTRGRPHLSLVLLALLGFRFRVPHYLFRALHENRDARRLFR